MQKILTKKQTRILNRQERFCSLAEQGVAYCSRHREYLTPEKISQHKCYKSKHSLKPCKYFKEDYDLEKLEDISSNYL